MSRPPKRILPCCQRTPEVGEYLLRNVFGPCCVGCWLAQDLARQEGGRNPQSEAIRGLPLVLPRERLEALKRHPDTETVVGDFGPDPEVN